MKSKLDGPLTGIASEHSIRLSMNGGSARSNYGSGVGKGMLSSAGNSSVLPSTIGGDSEAIHQSMSFAASMTLEEGQSMAQAYAEQQRQRLQQ